MSTAVAQGADDAVARRRSTALLHAIATQLRIDSVESTTAAASGHPTSCTSGGEGRACMWFLA